MKNDYTPNIMRNSLFLLFFFLYTEGAAQNVPTTDVSKTYQDRANWFRHAPQFNRDSTVFYFEKAIEMLEKALPVNYESLTQAYFSLAEYYNEMHDYGQADVYFAKAWDNWGKVTDKDKNKLLQYDILNLWSLTLVGQGQLTKALDLFTQAYNLLKDDTSPALQAKVLKDKGMFYSRFGLPEERDMGFHALEKSLKIYQTLNDSANAEAIFRIYTLMVFHYFEVEKLDSSDYYLRQLKKFLPLFNNPYKEAWYGMVSGSAAIKRQKYDEATRLILESMHILETYKMANTDYYQYDLFLLGNIEQTKGQYDKAINYYKKSREIALAIKYYDSAIDDLAALAVCYEKKGDFAQAFAYQKQYLLESEQVTKERSKQSLNENELKINLLSKEKELDKQRAQRLLFIVIALLALLLLGLLTIIYYRERKSKLKLEVQNHIIAQQSAALQQLDAAKTRFFANVSHELRTPLTLILGPLSTMMKSGTMDNKNFTLAGLIRQNAQGLLKLVNEILDLNKLEADKMTLQEAPVVVYNLIRRLLANFESHAERQNIRFTFNYELDTYLQLALDVNKFEKIINNLLSNALKFTPTAGAITLTVKDLHNRLQIDIMDTGRGIHPDDLPHVFNRFYQSNQPDAPTEGGTGIGLSLSMELVKLMGGTLHVDSHLGTGSTFYLTLPKKEILGTISTTDALEMQADVLITEEVVRPNLMQLNEAVTLEKQAATLLIVEDNAALRDYLTLILQAKYHVLTAENGQAALKMMNYELGMMNQSTPNSSFKPDLILSDVMMPIMDGFQLLTALKSEATFYGIPVIMLTARAELQDKLKALRIGVDDYLIKPFEEEELLARIDNLLKNAQHRQVAQLENLNTTVNDVENENEAAEIPPLSIDDQKWLADLENVLHQHIGDYNLSTDRIADLLHISRSQFYRRVRVLTGLTPIEYLQEIRFNHARLLLEQRTVSSVKAAAAAVGMRQVQNFSQHFKERFGKLPSEYLT
jgi:signal transduction histidine kinase/DNA-binding response OmpR family regulator